ncbi:MAG: hypothetical protein MPW14_15395 [Candidatus Manganitrophus sp.]|nr:hypothetical protein [Candidatus Manganitrophus sp.]WDT69803.1 MAG: hypothetical protein MPW17_13575 [Candidatus Manganitrophus sp.]WDT78568.1 MAG: hypothetical protein MPW14_15395 [Candidatus Manganitrophus sp.]
MDKITDILTDIVNRVKKWDQKKIAQERKEVGRYLLKQLFNQIPGASAVAALLVGGWIASTFTTSPITATLASWGLMKGGTRVVSSGTYKFLSVLLPLFAAGTTAYSVQKLLKYFREKEMEQNKMLVAQLDRELQAALQAKLDLLEKTREAGLLSESEYFTKKANLYQTYSRKLPEKIRELIINKLAG